MGRPKKKATELTTDKAIERLFGKKGAEAVRQAVHDLDEEKPARKPKKKNAG